MTLHDRDSLAAQRCDGDLEMTQDVYRDAGLQANQSQEQVLAADVIVSHAAGFIDRKLKDLP